MVYYRAALPRTAIEGTARAVYATWLSGTVAKQDIGNVFAPAPGFALEAGYRIKHHWLVFGGWEHVAWGVGDQSPYVTANVPTVTAFGNAFYAGARLTTSVRAIAPMFDAALAYSILEQDAQDARGGTASVALPSAALRLGAGASMRLFAKYERSFAIEPMVHLTFASVSTVNATASPANAPEHDFSGSTTNPALRVGLTIGVGGTFDLPLSWE